MRPGNDATFVLEGSAGHYRLAGAAGMSNARALLERGLEEFRGQARVEVELSGVTNTDGRCPDLIPGELPAGRYAICFAVAAYFRGQGVALPDPPFRWPDQSIPATPS